MSVTKGLPARPGFQVMPVIAMALVVMLLGLLLWILHRNEVEEARLGLIKDILWVEQNIHFHLTTIEEKLSQVSADVTRAKGDGETFTVAAQAVLGNNPELARVVLRDPHGKVLASVPPAEGDPSGMGPSSDAPWWGAFTLSKSIGRSAWSGPYAAPGTGQVFEVHVPLFLDQKFAGMVVGVVAVDALLVQDVPWWVAEKYKIEIIDSNGGVLAAKTMVELPEPGPSHQVRMEPPGQGMAVVATIFTGETNLARNVLAALIVALTLLSAWSLWAMRSHVRRRQVVEQELRNEHAFRKAMEDSLTVGMRARDLDGRITYANPAFCRMVGWTVDDLIGQAPPMPYWCPDAMDATMEMHRRVLAGDAPAEGFEIQFRRANEERFWALVYEAPLIDADGQHSGWMASVLDITERKESEELGRQQQEKLQRTARLITMGEMASTLAHELNQPLSAIASYNTGCLNRLDVGDMSDVELRNALTKIGVQAQRAGKIIRRIHDFVRKSEPKLQSCSLNRLVEDTAGFMEFDAKRRGVSLRVTAAPGNPHVSADRILVEQVVLNLVRNGIEAVAQAGVSKGGVTMSVVVEGGQAVVSVADQGVGIAPEVAENLFQPFFTTKEEGMGMGLNICRSIIEYHHGRLWFEPNPGGGAIFRFSLPVRG